ncbi:hypothetical protein D3C78_1504640 [compost metagenome]
MLGCRGEFITLQGTAVVQRTALYLGLHIGITTDQAEVLRHLRFRLQVEATRPRLAHGLLLNDAARQHHSDGDVFLSQVINGC